MRRPQGPSAPSAPAVRVLSEDRGRCRPLGRGPHLPPALEEPGDLPQWVTPGRGRCEGWLARPAGPSSGPSSSLILADVLGGSAPPGLARASGWPLALPQPRLPARSRPHALQPTGSGWACRLLYARPPLTPPLPLLLLLLPLPRPHRPRAALTCDHLCFAGSFLIRTCLGIICALGCLSASPAPPAPRPHLCPLDPPHWAPPPPPLRSLLPARRFLASFRSFPWNTFLTFWLLLLLPGCLSGSTLDFAALVVGCPPVDTGWLPLPRPGLPRPVPP